MRPRSLLGVALAALCTAVLGGGVLTAQAELRAFHVTLADGRVLTLTVDVPPGTELSQIDFPDVDEAQIVAIEETVPVQAPQITPPLTRTQPEVEREEPAVLPSDEPAIEEGSRRQRTTGDEKRDRRGRDGRKRRGTRRAGERRSTRLGEEGLPTLNDPTTSIAVPGPAPIGVPNFFIDKFRIPPFLLSIYQAAGIEYGVRWEVLAAINEIETDY
ncbi:MAG TPA: hypothetical protein VHF45_07930, partial [Thermoleophilaceae bacterium]|nr:hypothetical protein [Thermoleophilaceae bacterium]